MRRKDQLLLKQIHPCRQHNGAAAQVVFGIKFRHGNVVRIDILVCVEQIVTFKRIFHSFMTQVNFEVKQRKRFVAHCQVVVIVVQSGVNAYVHRHA